MNIEQAASFIAVSILFSFGVLAIVATACVINYLLKNFWHPVRVFTPDSFWTFGRQSHVQWIENHPEVVEEKTKQPNKSKEPK